MNITIAFLKDNKQHLAIKVIAILKYSVHVACQFSANGHNFLQCWWSTLNFGKTLGFPQGMRIRNFTFKLIVHKEIPLLEGRTAIIETLGVSFSGKKMFHHCFGR